MYGRREWLQEMATSHLLIIMPRSPLPFLPSLINIIFLFPFTLPLDIHGLGATDAVGLCLLEKSSHKTGAGEEGDKEGGGMSL